MEITGGGQSLWGDKKMFVGGCRFVILSYLVSCCRFMNQESRQAKIPQSRWDFSALSFSSHSGSSCHTTLLSSASYSATFNETFLTFRPFGQSLHSLTTLNPWSSQGANWFGFFQTQKDFACVQSISDLRNTHSISHHSATNLFNLQHLMWNMPPHNLFMPLQILKVNLSL